MLRIHTTFDYFEAQILIGMLRNEGIDARLPDTDVMRLDWFWMTALGGFRILVADADRQRALRLLNEYAQHPDPPTRDDAPMCPRCHRGTGVEDPQPRRNVFLVLLLSTALIPALFAPLIIRYFKWRTRCSTCGFRWRALPRCSYAELTAMTESGGYATG